VSSVKDIINEASPKTFNSLSLKAFIALGSGTEPGEWGGLLAVRMDALANLVQAAVDIVNDWYLNLFYLA
jgi:hypothetical protein